jgi:uncharacterized protein YndB with AHSA1/START domain
MTNQEPIVVEQTIDAPADRVWSAITDKQQMPRWFFERIEDFRAEKGFETTFIVHNDGKDYPHHWRVTEVVPNQRIVYDWLHPGFPGKSFVVWELSKADAGTRVQLTHTGIESFPQDDPAFTREACSGGWKYFLERLKGYVERGKP